jgi:hypothetical protein
MERPLLTQERLKELLSYDQGTGHFTWLITDRRKVAGAKAGYLDGDGYVRIKIDGSRYLAHRLAWLYQFGSFPKHELDHADRNRSNNLISNLREASDSQNAANRCSTSNRLGMKGVYKRHASRPRQYESKIRVNGVQKHLGYFHTAEEASEAYKAASRTHFGEFAFSGVT